jgi:hypothetical protein
MGKKIKIWIPDHISESLKYLNSWIRVRDLFDTGTGSGMEKFESGINTPDPQHCVQQLEDLL